MTEMTLSPFVARNAEGKAINVSVFQKEWRELEGTRFVIKREPKTFETDDGETIIRLSRGRYRIMGTGEEITSNGNEDEVKSPTE
jgi:hypothetical protein